MPPFGLLSRHTAGQPVVGGAGGERSAAWLLRDAEAVRRRLPEASEGSEVLVICGDRYHFLVSILAAWGAGHAVGLPPNGQPALVDQLASQPRVCALLHDTDAANGLDVRPLLAREAPAADGFAPLEIPPERELATVYTSGTTAAQQPARKTAAQLLGEAMLLAQTFGIGPGDTILGTVPSHHVYGLLFTIALPLCSGAKVVRTTPLHAESVAAQARQEGATVLVGAPAHLRALANLGEEGAMRVRRIFSSGAPLDAVTARSLGWASPSIVDVLGSTETGGIAWREPATEELWRPFPGVRVEADAEGRMLLHSPLVEAGAPDPFPGADLVEPAPDGRFRHLGRSDGVVKVGGKRLHLAELEERLRSLAGVADAAVGARPAEGPRGTELLAAVVAPGRSADDLRRELRAWFDPVVLPRRLLVVPALPRETNGKLTKARFLALFEDPAPREFDVHQRRDLGDANQAVREVALRVPSTLVFFQGHFAGFPVLPGVVQLNNLVLHESRRAWPDLGGVRQLKRLKFRAPIRPEDELVLRLERPVPQKTVRFRIDRAGVQCCSGVVAFGET